MRRPPGSFHRMRMRRAPPARASDQRTGCSSSSLSFFEAMCGAFSSPALKREVRAQSFRREKTDGMLGLAVEHQVGEDLADHARELEPVPGARRGHHDVRVLQEMVDDEVRVHRVRVHADLRVAPLAVREWHAAAEPSAYPLLVVRGWRPVEHVRIGRIAEVQTGDLHALSFYVGEAVIDPVGILDDVDRKASERIALGTRLEPEEDVALHEELRRERGYELRHPRTGGDHQLMRFVATPPRGDAGTVGGRFPAVYRLPEPPRRAPPRPRTHGCGYA